MRLKDLYSLRHRAKLSAPGWAATMFVLCLLLALSSCSRHYGRAAVSAPESSSGTAHSVSYLIGDFGKPGRSFDELVAAIAADAAALEALSMRSAPMVLELGDNLYEEGLPRDLGAPGAMPEVEKLRAIASGFATVRYDGSQVPLVLIPGNHDYNDDALTNEDNLGDISRWYFLDELGIEGAGAWTHVPGDAAAFSSSADLYAHLDGEAAAHADFMAPMRVPHTNGAIHIVAIDSELVIDLYDQGHEALAAQYWDELDSELGSIPDGAWRMVAAHHPPVTYGKHGRPSLGNWVFGQGWPQFPNTRQKLLALAMPLGIAAAIVVHPAAIALAAVTPVSTAFVTGRKQDVGSEPYDRYAAELLRRAAAHNVDVVLAGHDHNTQIIDLDEVEGFDDDTLLVITGAGAKVDPVRRGPGTVAFLSDFSFVRMVQYDRGLSFEIVDRSGTARYRHDLRR